MKNKKNVMTLLLVIYIIVVTGGTFFLLYATLGMKPKFLQDFFSGCNTKYTITGTYYFQDNDGNISNLQYIIIEAGNIGDFYEGEWQDNNGLRGIYKFKSGQITFYLGSNSFPLAKGTLENNTLILKFDENTTSTYVKR